MNYGIAIVLFGLVAAIQALDVSKLRQLDLNPPGIQWPPKAKTHSNRITNGEIAEEKQFPYQVGLRIYIEGGAAWCGGTIISSRYILTAAHCTDSVLTGVDVYLGAYNISNPNEKTQNIIFVPKKYVTVHEDWDSVLTVNDLSIIKLPIHIQFNEFIQPAVLPPISDTYPNYEGQNVIASGWGKITDSATSVTDVLRWVELPIMTNRVCNRWYFGSIKESHICVKTTGAYSTCQGDSGGPLVLADGSNTIVGVTSFGFFLGCESGWPGVFSRTTYFRNWIKEKTNL